MCDRELTVGRHHPCKTYPDSTILSSELTMSCIVVSIPVGVRAFVTLSP